LFASRANIALEEEKQLKLALEISRLEQNSSNGQMKDIRKMSDITVGMMVEIVLLGQENTRQRTLGEVVRILSPESWQMEGVLVELTHEIIGRVTGLCDEKFVPTKYSLSSQIASDDEEEYLWVPAKEVEVESNVICPIGCGTSLCGMTDQEINNHVDGCLRVESLSKLFA